MGVGRFLFIFATQILQNNDMRKIVWLLLLFMGMTVTLHAQPKINFQKSVHEFGVILWKNPSKAVFKLKNTGDKPLVISKVATSCGCATAEWTKTPIMPGEEGEVTTVYDAKTLGRFHKTIGIYCNAAPKPIYLAIRGEVSADPKDYTFTHPIKIGDIRVNKQSIEFDDVNKGEFPQMEILVANTSKQVYTPVLMHLPPYLQVKAVPEKLGRNRTGKLIVTLRTDKLPKLGLTTASVYLSRFMGDKVGNENEIPVSVVLLPDFSNLTAAEKKNPPVVQLSQNKLDVGVIAGNKKRSKNIQIKNVGKSPLVIQDLQVFNPALGVQLKKRVINPGATIKLKITAYGKYWNKVKSEPRVLLITNDPATPKLIIHVKATLKE